MENCFIINNPAGISKIIITENGLETMRDYLKVKYPEDPVAIITDKNVAGFLGEKVKSKLSVDHFLVVEAGEKSKSFEVVKDLCSQLLEEGFPRNGVIIGMGGGVVTDLAGFVASIYMRGCTYMALPTSLLSMIDASVGGKTAINLIAKNVIGNFYPAKLILIDLDFLETLPEKEMKIGVAEVIKYATVLEPALEDILLKEHIDYVNILVKGIQTKASVVNSDSKDWGLRKVLNFGHTTGHAIEALGDGKYSHGEAISIGMMLANKVAMNLGKQTQETADRVKTMLDHYDLPTELPADMTDEKLLPLIAKDKKMDGKNIDYVLCTGIGRFEMIKLTPEEIIKLMK